METHEKFQKVSYTMEKRKMLASAPLIALVVMISVANQRFMTEEQSNQRQSRTIASVARSVGMDPEQVQWQARIAKNVAEGEARDLASIGSRPDPFDDLRFGLLEGKYAFEKEGDRVSEVRFVEGQNDRPKYVNEPGKFLEQYHSVWGQGFARAESTEKRREDGLMKESFLLFDESNKEIGKAVFETDGDGRFLKLRFTR